MKKFFKGVFKKFNWAGIKSALIKWLKGEAVKLAIKKILGSAMAGGFKVWVIKFVVEELFEEIAEPLIKYAFRRMGYLYNRERGKILVKRLNDAQDSNDQDEYNSTIDDILGGRR